MPFEAEPPDQPDAPHRLPPAASLTAVAVRLGRLGAWGFDVGSAVVECSPQLCSILGLPEGAAPAPAQLLALAPPEYQPRLMSIVQRAAREGGEFDLELEVMTSPGRRAWVRLIGEAVRGADGQVRRLHGALQDIDQNKRAQQALHESQRTMLTLMANLPGMAYRAENRPDWPMSFASQGALALTGFTPQELVAGRPRYGDLIHPDDRERVWAEVQAAVAERRQFRLTYRIGGPAGEKWVWEQGSGVYEADGTLRCLEGFLTDVSDVRRAQQEVARLNATLEQQVRRRTQQLEIANAEMEAMAYSIAHDLRAPMTSLAGFSRVLEQTLGGRGTLDERSAHYLRRIQGNVQAMSELIDALLSLARLSSVAPAREPLDLAAIAREVLGLLREQEPQRAVELDLPAQLPAEGDPRLVRQLLANLLGNAWKFSRAKPATFIGLGVEAGPEGQPVYFVQDRGVGFDMAHSARLFNAFHRLHTPAEFEGTGVGLALARKIVLRHGGRIWARAQPGQGATFFFTLGAPAGRG